MTFPGSSADSSLRRRGDGSASRARGCRLGLLLLVLGLVSHASPARADDSAKFGDAIAPLFKERCVKCHGPAKSEAKLDLSTAASVARGGKNGPIVVPHQVDDSLLWDRVDADEMPPKHPLSAEEKARIEKPGSSPRAGVAKPLDEERGRSLGVPETEARAAAGGEERERDARAARPLHRGRARTRRPDPLRRGPARAADPPGEPRAHRPAAHARRGRGLPGRSRTRGIFTNGRSLPGKPAPTVNDGGNTGSTRRDTPTRMGTSAPIPIVPWPIAIATT